MFSFDNIHSINRMQSSERYQNDFPNRFKPRILKDLIRFCFVTLWDLFLGLINISKYPSRNKIIFFYQTKNNYNTVKPVQEITPDSILLYTRQNSWGKGYLFPTGVAYTLSFAFLPLALYHLFKSQGNQRKAFKSHFDTYLKTYGLMIIYELYLRQISPKALILTNDHNRDPLIISSICKKNKIPIFFIPHGSFSGETLEKNPMHFDFALVSGDDQKKKIEKVIHPSKIYIVGRPISDNSFTKQNKAEKVMRVGICISLLYKHSNVQELLNIIAENTNLQMFVRPHPALQNVKALSSINCNRAIHFSNPINETPIEFLGKVDAIITGCSGIHLDAGEMNVYPIFYDFSERYDDFNNFVKYGVATYAGNPEECLKLLKRLSIKKPNVRMNAKYYNGTIGTKDDGKSSELAKNLILKLSA